jgi:ectoine hydroxylase-related dioxygenase (phytanoyl-CoA dioxygenase family)
MHIAQTSTEQYRRDGYITASNPFSVALLGQLRAESDRLLRLCSEESERYAPRIEWEKDYLAQEDQAGMERVIRKLEPVSDLSPLFAELAFSEAVAGPVRELFGEDVELFEDKLNLKLPGGSSYPWHQDWSCCWRAFTDDLITCFIYLDDADEKNGCLQVVPGSHAQKIVYPFKQGSRFTVDDASFDQGQIVPVPLKAGEMIFFDPYLLHFSDLNRSATPRRSIIYTYNPARLGQINQLRFPPVPGA